MATKVTSEATFENGIFLKSKEDRMAGIWISRSIQYMTKLLRKQGIDEGLLGHLRIFAINFRKGF